MGNGYSLEFVETTKGMEARKWERSGGQKTAAGPDLENALFQDTEDYLPQNGQKNQREPD